MQDAGGRVTLLLREVEGGSETAKAELFEMLHAELVRIASAQMRGQRRDHTLQPTALVNEAYLRLFRHHAPSFRNRSHFMAAVARAMRCVLVDAARSRAADRNGGGRVRVTLGFDAPAPSAGAAHDVLDVHEALDRLERVDARWALVVELVYFGGLSVEEVAANLGLSEPTVRRAWTRARMWLLRELSA